MANSVNKDKLKDGILQAAGDYCKKIHGNQKKFKAGDRINYAERFFDEKEIINLIDASLDFWLTSGKYTLQFEKKLSSFLNVRHCSIVNSGSSANLLAFQALTSPKLREKRIKRGDEVITVAAAFPTTVAPIIQYGAVPVFVDVNIPFGNIDDNKLKDAISDNTKAVFISHTLGNPFNLKRVKEFCDNNDLWLIEDNCDSLGSKYYLDQAWVYTGTVGHIGTSSFYPAHHITMGEGGAVYTDDKKLKCIVESLRDWGRDCWCKSGKDNTCENRFSQQFGELPYGYDHKYVFSHFGYNLKATDLQAAIGCAQLRKLPDLIQTRKNNWFVLKAGVSDLDDRLIIHKATPNSDPSWFGFLITVRRDVGFTRDDIIAHLERNNIQTRMLFAGNIIRHPCFDEIRGDEKMYRIVGNLKNTDVFMNNSFWIGVHPGLTEGMLSFMVDTIREFILSK